MFWKYQKYSEKFRNNSKNPGKNNYIENFRYPDDGVMERAKGAPSELMHGQAPSEMQQLWDKEIDGDTEGKVLMEVVVWYVEQLIVEAAQGDQLHVLCHRHIGSPEWVKVVEIGEPQGYHLRIVITYHLWRPWEKGLFSGKTGRCLRDEHCQWKECNIGHSDNGQGMVRCTILRRRDLPKKHVNDFFCELGPSSQLGREASG